MVNLVEDEITFEIPARDSDNYFKLSATIIGLDKDGILNCRLNEIDGNISFTVNAVKNFVNISALKRKRDA